MAAGVDELAASPESFPGCGDASAPIGRAGYYRTHTSRQHTHRRFAKMAALATSAKVQISKGKLGCNVRGLSRKAAVAPKAVSRNTVAAAVSGDVPDMGKRNVMNLLLVAGIAVFVLMEKILPRARWIGPASGVILMAFAGAFVLTG